MAQITLNSSGVASNGSLVLQSNGTTTAATFDTSQKLTLPNDAVVNGLTVGRGAGAVSTNTAVGASALAASSTGIHATGIGYQALTALTSGDDVTAVGYQALKANTTGYSNSAYGSYSLYLNTTGLQNSALGDSSLSANTTGGYNTAVGGSALASNTTANYNTAVGYQAGYNNTTGTENSLFGRQAGQNITTGSANICLGSLAGTDAVFNVTTENNRVVLGYNAITNAYIKVAWTVTSDARDKTDVQPMTHGLAFVQQLNPVSYRWKTSREDATPVGTRRYGFLAQEIMELEGDNPVIIDNEQPEHLKYQGEALVPVLVKAIQELKAEFDAYKEAHP